jgi:hypothetical protein
VVGRDAEISLLGIDGFGAVHYGVVRRSCDGNFRKARALQNQALAFLLWLALCRPVGVEHSSGEQCQRLSKPVLSQLVGSATHRMALSNTDLRFICVRAEHSTYL